jgi:hypothetical protein
MDIDGLDTTKTWYGGNKTGGAETENTKLIGLYLRRMTDTLLLNSNRNI